MSFFKLHLHTCIFLFLSHSVHSQNVDYKSSTVYQIYPRSYYDSNADGIGDIQGIIEKLDYIASLGFEHIWISPFFLSPQKDFGYDISNFMNISKEYGSLSDVEKLIAEVHKREMKIVFDMVLNHTSDQHPWFQNSISVEPNTYSDFYVWQKGRGKNGKRPPNNWKSMIGGGGWHYYPEKKMWYWACFLPFQPDLNYRNPAVKDTMFNTVKYWLDKGVDGFRLDIFNAIYEDSLFRNNPFSLKIVPSENNSNGFLQKQIYNINHPDNYDLATELRALIDQYPNKFLVGEVFGNTEQIMKYTGKNNDGLNLVFLFKSLRTPLKAKQYKKLAAEYENHFSEPLHPTWVFGNHDRFRRFSFLGNNEMKMKLSASLQFTLRGTPFTYYGEEIGLKQAKIKTKNAQDPLGKRFKILPRSLLRWTKNSLNRDECRTPMQWSSEKNSGFSTANTTWLPVNDDFVNVNVKLQENDSNSILEHYRKIIHFRKNHTALQTGSYQTDTLNSKGKIFAYYRNSNEEQLLIVHNFGKRKKRVKLPQNGELIFSTYTQSQYEKMERFQSFIFKIPKTE